MRYCSNCGAEIADDARFCPSCGKPAGEAGEAKKREKDEKGEKGEKDEKDEKGEKDEGDRTGALIGGMILILLGGLLLLGERGTIAENDIGPYFLLGIGIILLLGALWKYWTNQAGSATGLFFGGLVLTVLGIGAMSGFEHTGAIALLIVGVAIVFFGVRAMKRNPQPPR